MENFFNKIFTPKCEICSSWDDILCQECLQKVRCLENQYCILCDKKALYGQTHPECITKSVPLSSYSIYEYQGVVRESIHKSKYISRKFSLIKKLTTYGLNNLKANAILNRKFEDYIVVPIPLSDEKYKLRGFNQAEIIAREVSKHFKLPNKTNILCRTKSTTVQHVKTRLERFKSLSKAFSVQKDISGQKILLVDDICTTGATMLEASKELYLAEASEVRCFTLSKTLRTKGVHF